MYSSAPYLQLLWNNAWQNVFTTYLIKSACRCELSSYWEGTVQYEQARKLCTVCAGQAGRWNNIDNSKVLAEDTRLVRWSPWSPNMPINFHNWWVDCSWQRKWANGWDSGMMNINDRWGICLSWWSRDWANTFQALPNRKLDHKSSSGSCWLTCWIPHRALIRIFFLNAYNRVLITSDFSF